MENHEFGVAPEAFTKWIVLNDTYDILSTSKDRSVLPVLLHCDLLGIKAIFGSLKTTATLALWICVSL